MNWTAIYGDMMYYFIHSLSLYDFYFAEVYLNGHKKAIPKGMFWRRSFNITDILHLEA